MPIKIDAKKLEIFEISLNISITVRGVLMPPSHGYILVS